MAGSDLPFALRAVVDVVETLHRWKRGSLVALLQPEVPAVVAPAAEQGASSASAAKSDDRCDMHASQVIKAISRWMQECFESGARWSPQTGVCAPSLA